MFTGIIEEIGKVVEAKLSSANVGDDKLRSGNLEITVEAALAEELKIDQSVSHNGVCLTVISLKNNTYSVTAIEETLLRTTLSELKPGALINLERGMKMDARLDGHIVQGHVDQTGICEKIETKNGSHIYTFSYHQQSQNVTIEKGSITINGVSLTVVESSENRFSVAIIPYTFEHTTFQFLKEGSRVNLEFDVIGKYVKRLLGSFGN